MSDLRRLIANMPDDTPILRPASDHSYARSSVHDGSASCDEKGRMHSEWWGAENAAEGVREVRALIVR